MKSRKLKGQYNGCNVLSCSIFNRKDRVTMRYYINHTIPSKYGDLDVYYTFGMFGVGYYCVEVDSFTHFCGFTLQDLVNRLIFLDIAI